MNARKNLFLISLLLFFQIITTCSIFPMKLQMTLKKRFCLDNINPNSIVYIEQDHENPLCIYLLSKTFSQFNENIPQFTSGMTEYETYVLDRSKEECKKIYPSQSNTYKEMMIHTNLLKKYNQNPKIPDTVLHPRKSIRLTYEPRTMPRRHSSYIMIMRTYNNKTYSYKQCYQPFTLVKELGDYHKNNNRDSFHLWNPPHFILLCYKYLFWFETGLRRIR